MDVLTGALVLFVATLGAGVLLVSDRTLWRAIYRASTRHKWRLRITLGGIIIVVALLAGDCYRDRPTELSTCDQSNTIRLHMEDTAMTRCPWTHSSADSVGR